MQHALLVITIMVLWKLVHLETSTYGYMLLAFENSKSTQVTNRATNMISIERECWA